MSTTNSILHSLQKKLDAHIAKLATIREEPLYGSEEGKVSELLLSAEAHNEMFDIEIMNVVNRQDNSYYDDQSACNVIKSQIEISQERNLESALKSLERAMMQCDTSIVQNIEVSAQAVEAIIPALETKLHDRKREMSSSHDSSKLLTAAVEKNYFTMRDGYLELIKKVYEEASVQWKALLQIQEPNTKWHLQKLHSIIGEARDHPDLEARREALLQTAKTNLDHYCDGSFRRISESKMYEEKELYLQKLETVKRKVFSYKKKTVREFEQHLNNAEITIDGFYMTSVEEINDHLYNLQESLHQLAYYDRKLTQHLVLAFKRELKIDRLYRASLASDSAPNSPLNRSLPVNSFSSPGKMSRSADSEVIIQLGRQTMEDVNSSFQIGTMLRSLAYSCDLPPEYTEQVLEYVLFEKT